MHFQTLTTLNSTNNTKCFQTLEFNFIYLYQLVIQQLKLFFKILQSQILWKNLKRPFWIRIYDTDTRIRQFLKLQDTIRVDTSINFQLKNYILSLEQNTEQRFLFLVVGTVFTFQFFESLEGVNASKQVACNHYYSFIFMKISQIDNKFVAVNFVDLWNPQFNHIPSIQLGSIIVK